MQGSDLPEHLLVRLQQAAGPTGGVDDAQAQALARLCGRPPVDGVAVRDFYHLLSAVPVRYRVLFTDGPVERLAGRQDLQRQLCELLWAEPNRVTEDKHLLVGDTACIGLTDQAPSALVNGVPLAPLDARRIEDMAKRIRDGVPVGQWPAEWLAPPPELRLAGPLTLAKWPLGAAFQRAARVDVLAEIESAGLRGRGGAGFPTASKWRFAREAAAGQRVVVCNADEGEPGTFKDRWLLIHQPQRVLEGMAVCARTIGAAQGFLYLRAEYAGLLPGIEKALETLRSAGILGAAFDITVRVGAGAYVCGEESALIESLEGKRGIPRHRPPFPVTAGYLGQPTVVNNVETFAAAAFIAAGEGASFAAMGTPQSRGSKLYSVAGDCALPGIYEVAFGTSLSELLAACGASQTKAVQVGGPSGRLVGRDAFDQPLAFEALASGGAITLFDQSRSLFDVARAYAHFFAGESCGLCTPCRVGTRLQVNLLDRLASGEGDAADVAQLRQVGEALRRASHCGLGMTASHPVADVLAHFPEEFERRLTVGDRRPAFSETHALAVSRQLTGR